MNRKAMYAVAAVLTIVLFMSACEEAAQPKIGAGSSCTSDSQCATGVCAASVCSDKSIGNACTDNNQCATEICAAGVCSDRSIGSVCTSNDHCTGQVACIGGVCGGRSAQTVCTTDSQCASGLCHDGSCCFTTRTATNADGDITLSSAITDDYFLYTCTVTGPSMVLWSDHITIDQALNFLLSDPIAMTDDRTAVGALGTLLAKDTQTMNFTVVMTQSRAATGVDGSFTGFCRISFPNSAENKQLSLPVCR